jgi:diguanylate cyclase (GGDEF)-like protein
MLLSLCGAALILAVVGTTALILSNLRDRALHESERHLLANAAVLAKITGRDLQAIDLVETNLIEQMEAAAIVSSHLYAAAMAGYDVHTMLHDKSNGFPCLDAIMLIGADGKLINTSASWPVPASDRSHEIYFKTLEGSPQLSSYLSAPIRDANSGGRWTIYLAHKFTGADGEFLGLVVGAINTGYLEEFYHTLTRGPKDSIALFRQDATMLARYPHEDAFMGQSFADKPLYKHVLSRVDNGLVRQIAKVGGEDRLVAGARLTGSSSYVTVTTTVNEVLADWRSNAEYLVGIAMLLVLAIGGTGTVLVAHFRRQSVQLDAALNNLSQGVCMYDGGRRLILCNDRYAEMYGLPPEMMRPGTTLQQELNDRASRGLYAGGDFEAHIRRELDIAHANKPASTMTELSDGRILTSAFQPMKGGGFVVTLEDITERKRAEKRIAHLANHDYLTGLPNRVAFAEYLADSIGQALRDDREFAVLCLDLDRFKEVNDFHGHLVGDTLLREVARRLQLMADGAFLARVGGDEFVMIMAGGSREAAREQAARLQAAIAEEIDVGGRQLQIGLSVGIACCPVDGNEPTVLLANADLALYRAKARERGSICFFEPEMAAALRERRDLQSDLQSAIANDELCLHFQPLARIDGDVVGFEALVRWRHPKRGFVPPSTFIPLAEENGLIVQVGEWILRTVCREAASWTKPLQVAVNLSPVQFRSDDIVKLVHTILIETGLSPDRLELEITEGVLIDDFSRAVAILRRLKALGVRIALDDFGTGYSSMSYLQSFPFDKIKIDRAFVSNLERSAQSKAIVRAVVGLARGLELPVIAEGVETRAQLDLLARAGCDLVQGYLIGKPATIDTYAGFIGGASSAAAGHFSGSYAAAS